MSRRDLRIKKLLIAVLELMIILAVILGIIWFLKDTGIAEKKQEWTVSYPMANSGISWDGAGYNGIYGR